MCKYPFGSGGKRVYTNPPVASRWASRSAAVTCGFPPGLCNLPRKPSAKTDLGLEGAGVEAAGEASAFAGFAGFGSCLQSNVNQRRQPTHILGWRGHTLPLGLAASFAPNLSSSADSTAFFTSRVFAQRNAGVFLSAVMAAPMFAHPVTADELTYSATALESASGVMLNPVGVVGEEENQMSDARRD